MQMTSQSPTKDNRESTVPCKSPWGPGSPLCARVCTECAWWGRLRWGGRALARGRRETPRSDYVEGICYVSFLPSPLLLCAFSPCSSLCPLFLVPFFCICLGGSWSVPLIDSIFLWHLSSDWLKDLEGEKTLIK